MSKQLILYVEDDALSREIMALVIEDLPMYELLMLADSVDFQKRIEALTIIPTLILLDIHVQPMTGFDMLELLKSLPGYSDVPVLALTASVMSEEITRLRKAGFNGAIAKPIDQDNFAHHIERVLAGNLVWVIDNH